jgi:hypothetical protein
MKEFYGIKDKESDRGSLAFLVDQALNLLSKNVELSLEFFKFFLRYLGVRFNVTHMRLQLLVKGSVVDYQSLEVVEAEYLFEVI